MVSCSNRLGGRITAGDAQPFKELGTNSGRHKRANHLAVRSDALFVEAENFLHADDVLFHAGDLGDAGHLAGSVAHTRSLHHDGDGRGDLLAHRLLRQVHVAHGDHRFKSGDGVARGVGVNRGHRAFVTGVHGLQHVKRFFAADFAHDDAVWTHTQAVDQQLPLLDGALAFDVRRTGFQADNVLLRQAEFGRVLNGDQALVVGNVLRKNIQQSCFTGAGAAGDDDADARLYSRGQQLHHFRGDALQLDQLSWQPAGRCRNGEWTATVRRAPAEE